MITPNHVVFLANEKLREKSPLLAGIIDKLKWVSTDSHTDDDGTVYPISTVSVNKLGELLYNPSFILKSSEMLTVFSLGVVAQIEMTNVVGRRGDRDNHRWNIAANIVAVEAMVEFGFPVPPNVMRAETNGIDFAPQTTTEEVYEMLMKNVHPLSDQDKLEIIRDVANLRERQDA